MGLRHDRRACRLFVNVVQCVEIVQMGKGQGHKKRPAE
jgi:hypothetical protein